MRLGFYLDWLLPVAADVPVYVPVYVGEEFASIRGVGAGSRRGSMMGDILTAW